MEAEDKLGERIVHSRKNRVIRVIRAEKGKKKKNVEAEGKQGQRIVKKKGVIFLVFLTNFCRPAGLEIWWFQFFFVSL